MNANVLYHSLLARPKVRVKVSFRRKIRDPRLNLTPLFEAQCYL